MSRLLLLRQVACISACKAVSCRRWICAIWVLAQADLSSVVLSCCACLSHNAVFEAIVAVSGWWHREDMRFWGLQLHMHRLHVGLHPHFRHSTDGQEQVHDMPSARFHTMTGVFYGYGWPSVVDNGLKKCKCRAKKYVTVWFIYYYWAQVGAGYWCSKLLRLSDCVPRAKLPTASSLCSLSPVSPTVTQTRNSHYLFDRSCFFHLRWHREASHVNLSQPPESWKCRAEAAGGNPWKRISEWLGCAARAHLNFVLRQAEWDDISHTCSHFLVARTASISALSCTYSSLVCFQAVSYWNLSTDYKGLSLFFNTSCCAHPYGWRRVA